MNWLKIICFKLVIQRSKKHFSYLFFIDLNYGILAQILSLGNMASTIIISGPVMAISVHFKIQFKEQILFVFLLL